MSQSPSPTVSSITGSEWWLGVERFIVFAVVTFASQITVGGQQLDLTTASGRAVAVGAFVSALYVVVRKTFLGN